MKRFCDGCGTQLRGKKGHGFVVGRRLVCGRTEREQSTRDAMGRKSFGIKPSPECRW